MEVVGGSIPLATTKPLTDDIPCAGEPIPMLKIIGSTVGIIFLIGLVVVLLLPQFIF